MPSTSQSASQIFYLAVFALLGPAHGSSQASSSSSLLSPDACAINPKATVSDACVSYGTLDSLNDKIAPTIQSITQDTDFFAYYRLNLFNKQCFFWSDESGMCGNIACAVSTLESEDEIPEIWRAEELSKLEGPKAGHPGKKLQQERPKERPLQGMLGEDVGESCVVEYDDECDERDFCVPEDEGATAKGDYVSLVDNPERFTGYAGPGARQVWDAIYRENCFLKPLAQSQSFLGSSPASNFKAADDFRNILQNYERGHPQHNPTNDELLLDDDCIEKRVFHRLVSGMHASISTHICWDYFNQLTGQWSPNMECYKERLHDHPERISNLYFNYALVMRAVAKLHKHLQNYTFCSTEPSQDLMTKHKVSQLTSEVSSGPYIFDENTMFQDPSAIGLKEDFRNRFRNVSRLMDCIGCDKCRLWGKLQTAGYGAALKVLFEYDETKNGENPPLRRTELVALINTLGRISKSISSVQKFRTALESGSEESLFASAAEAESQRLRSESSKDGTEDWDNLSQPEDEEKDNTGEGQRTRQRGSVADEFMAEWNLIWRTFKYVIRSWMQLPGTLWNIFILELDRLWSYWLGFPVPPRSWSIHLPSVDEL